MSPGFNFAASRGFAHQQHRASVAPVNRAGIGLHRNFASQQRRDFTDQRSRFVVAPADGGGHNITLDPAESAVVTIGPDGTVTVAVSAAAPEVPADAEPTTPQQLPAVEVEGRRRSRHAAAAARAYAVSNSDGSVTIYPEPSESLRVDAADPLAILVSAEPA